MRLLLIEDDERIGAFVHKGLTQEGHIIDWTRRGDEGLDHLLAGAHDVAIVDVMLPGKSGLEVIREARRRKVNTPLIVVSARDAVDDRIKGLEAGADDYLTKQFAFAELVARVQALSRRAAAPGGNPFELRFHGVVIDLRTRKVERDGVPVHLQAKEFALLEYLLRNPERVLSKTMILEHVWEYRFDPQTNVVDVLVSRLRSKLDRDHPTKLIHTIRGAGYVLRVE
ncbi:response regulator transcription factor [soil metagenome]